MTEASGPGGGSRLDRIEANMEALQEGLLAALQITTKNATAIEQLTGRFDRLIERAEADRELILENQVQIRRIWEYLLTQRPNGRGES